MEPNQGRFADWLSKQHLLEGLQTGPDTAEGPGRYVDEGHRLHCQGEDSPEEVS